MKVEHGSKRGLLPPPRPVQLGKRRKQINSWKQFYKDLFGVSTFESMVFPWEREVTGEILIINNSIPIAEIVHAFHNSMGYVWTCNLNSLTTPVRPKSVWYVACLNSATGKTSEQGISLREHLLIGLKYFLDCGLNFGMDTTTVCTGSMFSNGDHPHVVSTANAVFVDRNNFLDDNFYFYEVSMCN